MIWRVCRSVNQSVNMRATVCEGEVVGEEEGVLEDDMEGVSFSQSVSQYESYSM